MHLYLVVTVSLSSIRTRIFSSVKYRTSAGRSRLATSREEGKEQGWVVNAVVVPSLPSVSESICGEFTLAFFFSLAS